MRHHLILTPAPGEIRASGFYVTPTMDRLDYPHRAGAIVLLAIIAALDMLKGNP